MYDLIRLRRELNQLIINAFNNYIKTGDVNGKSSVCSTLRRNNHLEIYRHYVHYKHIHMIEVYQDKPGILPCNKCMYFTDYIEDKASFITD